MLDLKTADITQTRFYRDVFQLGAKEGRQEGKAEGKAEGKQEGKQEGEAQLIIRQVNRRCGILSPNQEAQIRSLDLNQLESLGEALLDFTTIADLEAWLNGTHQEK
jgi:predicted transposase YdaD